MDILMLGWEFPPYKTGGLGTACFGLTRGLSKLGVRISFVIPKSPIPVSSSFLNLINAKVNEGIDYSHLKAYFIDSPLIPYASPEQKRLTEMNKKAIKGSNDDAIYGRNLFEEVYIYSEKVRMLAKNLKFDLIHAHDWMTYPAGIKVKEDSGKKLVLHIHATEFDRTGGFPNPTVYAIEKEGFEKSDLIIAVSNYTKRMVVSKYGIPESKVRVLYNAVDFPDNIKANKPVKVFSNDNVVLFLGRLTIQKGPEYFIDAAKRILEFEPNTKFFIAGSGEMMPQLIEKTIALGISDKVFFTGFLTGPSIDEIYGRADVYVMPSVSEPFGITPLEAMANGTPTVISKQSGVSEIIKNTLTVDFWDLDEITNKVVAILRYKTLKETISEHGVMEVQQITWDSRAEECKRIYEEVLKE
ncbi:MAG: hypothetical protein PWQ87_26 [Candidatus Woesearchaeota archaeon]|nr:hypothetical protein [Candidatus Woesearchaeota archaeon]